MSKRPKNIVRAMFEEMKAITDVFGLSFDETLYYFIVWIVRISYEKGIPKAHLLKFFSDAYDQVSEMEGNADE